MISNQFSTRILDYLASSGKTLDEAILEEGAKRTKLAFKRQLMEDREDKPGVLRMSGGGQCVRKQWYSYTGAPREPLSGRTINTFLTGDLLEVGLSIAGRLAGWQLSGKPEGEDEIELDGVKGHPDDLLFVPEENKFYLIEYKTMSDYSYRKFEADGLDDTWGYATQASLYCEALDIDEYILVGICKGTGHVCDRVYKKCNTRINKARSRWEVIKNAKVAPEREFSPEPETKYNRSTKNYDATGRRILGIVCSYCPYKADCWPDATQEFKGEKPIWLVDGSPSEVPI